MKLRILLILGALSAFGPMAIDFYLPSFPSLAVAFATDVEHIQLSLASYFVGVALGQLIYGPLSDRFGRRLPLLIGTSLFTLASLGCALSPSLDWLIGMRFVQALGGCAGMVISRAIVRDLCDPLESARTFSKLMLVMGLAPILAPVGGGVLLDAFGWQSIFLVLVLFAAASLLAVWRWLPETLGPEQPRFPLSGALVRYVHLLRDRQLIGYGLAGGLGMAGMFAYISGSPFVFIDLYGVTPSQYGVLFGINAACFVAFAQINGWLLRHRGPAHWLPGLVIVYVVAALCLLVSALLQPAHLLWLLIPIMACMGSLACILPNASACAMAGHGSQAGSASALMGFLQFAVAALASSAVGALHDGSARPMAVVMFFCALASALLIWLIRRSAPVAADY